MGVFVVSLERELFPELAVLQTCHRYSGAYFVELASSGRLWEITMRRMDGLEMDADLPARFKNDALDDVLRSRIREQTAGVTELLLTAALSSAGREADEIS